MKKQEKGFTLIELLAVIVILAIIALIAVPVIMNIIAKTNKSAFKDSAYGIVKAGELYYSEKLLEVDGMMSTKIFEFPEAVGLDLKGSRPTSGVMKISKEGKIALAISNGKYCAKKGYDDSDVSIDEDLENCILPKEELENQNLNISSSNSCIKYDEICENGAKINVRVNNIENYDFYVIKDDGINLVLIMNKNLGSQVEWYSDRGNNEKGPITALKALKERTNNWSNIKSYSYILEDDIDNPHYQPISGIDYVTDVRARLPRYDELHALGCTESNNSCPAYLYGNLSSSSTEESPYGYWLSTSNFSSSNTSLSVTYEGKVTNYFVNYLSRGLRPVIEISKTI